MRGKSAIVLSLLLYTSAATAQQAADWPMFNRDYAGDRWAPIVRDLPAVLSVEVQTLT